MMTGSMFKAPSLHFTGMKEQDNNTKQICLIFRQLADIFFHVPGDSSA